MRSTRKNRHGKGQKSEEKEKHGIMQREDEKGPDEKRKEKSNQGLSASAKYYKKFPCSKVAKNSILSSRMCDIAMKMVQLTFKTVEEIFSTGIVVGVALNVGKL